MTNYRDSAYFSKVIHLEGIPKEFLPNLDDNDSVMSDPQFIKNNEDESERDPNSCETAEKEETTRKVVERKLEWPLCCWICRQPITKKRTYIICSDICKRPYHNGCHNFMKNYFHSIYDKIIANKKSARKSKFSNKIFTELGVDVGYFNNGSVFNPGYENKLRNPTQKTGMNLYAHNPESLKSHYYNKDSVNNHEKDIYKKCFFCTISHIGCNGCRKFFLPKNLVKCCIEECTTFYCYPACLSKTRIIIPDKKVIDINMSMCGHLHNLIDANGRPKFICHSHTCWSCYDCDRYTYFWESFWRNEHGKGKNVSLISAWNSLKTSCRGKVESSHFAKGKKIAKPQRYPDIRGFKTFIQSRPVSHYVTNADDLYNSSDDGEEHFQKGPSNVLVRCIRCDRTWCTHCVHPDVHILPKSGKQIICHDCIHIQVGCTLAQYSKDSNNRANIMKKECIYPTIRLDTGVPQEIYTQLKDFITEHSSYEKKLNLEPTFISKHPAQDSDDDHYLLDIQKSALMKAKSRRNKKSEQRLTKSVNRTLSDHSPLRSISNDAIVKQLHEMKSKEWNHIIKGCSDSVLSKISGEFKYITSNVVSIENKKLISAPDSDSRCQCHKKCGEDCTNVQKNVECNPKNCALSDTNCGNKRFANFLCPKLKLNYVHGKGIGTVATEDIQKDELVCEYVGEVISHSDFQKFVASSSFAEIDDSNQCHWYIMKIHKDMYIDSTHMGNVARFINHSCDPNCASIPFNVKGTYRMGVFALRKIKQGEEVTYNYGFTSKGVGGGFQCRCKAKNCRGIIGSQIAHSPESIMNIEASKKSGAEVDVLSQLTSDMASICVANKEQTLKQQPSPLDVLNGIWTSGDLHRYEKMLSKLGSRDSNKSFVSKVNSEVPSTINPLSNMLADNAHVSEAQFNYVKLLTMNSMSMLDFEIANTKKFATNIPWGIVAMGHKDISMNVAIESSAGFFEMYLPAKRYIQISSMLTAGCKSGKAACENVQDIMDLTWGGTESCSACGGYGDCRWCDKCGDVLHDDNNCGDFYIDKEGYNLCTLCQNSDHRYKWYLSTNMERENMAMELWAIRMRKKVDEHFQMLKEVCEKRRKKSGEGSGKPGPDDSKGGLLYIDEGRMFCTQEEFDIFNNDPNQYYEYQAKSREYCEDSMTKFECFT